MRIGSMLGDIANALVHRPVTEKYPFARRAAPDRLRGALWFRPDTCTGCMMCVKDCPANALELIILDKKAKKYVMPYHIDRCTFCAQCVKSCNQKCLGMSSEQWELAALDKDVFVINLGKDEDVRTFLARRIESGPVAPAPAPAG